MFNFSFYCISVFLFSFWFFVSKIDCCVLGFFFESLMFYVSKNFECE